MAMIYLIFVITDLKRYTEIFIPCTVGMAAIATNSRFRISNDIYLTADKFSH